MSTAGQDHEQRTIHVALAADAAYMMPLTVAMCSAAMNCDRRRRLIFYIIHQRVTDGLKERVEASLRKCGFPDARIKWLSIPDNQISDLRVANTYLSVVAYARLLIPSLLPDDVSKVLYLDSDVVVTGDLAELWDTELGSKALFAVRDLIAWVGAPRGVADYEELGISPQAKYFNSGVLLMNLRKWRDEKISSRVFEYIRAHRTALRMEDQEALNATLFADWGELPFRWNWQIPWRMYRLGRRTMPWNPDEPLKHIVHFTTSEKPWLPGCDVKEKEVFFQYLDKTDWAGWRVPLAKEIVGRVKRAAAEARARASIWRRTLEMRRAGS